MIKTKLIYTAVLAFALLASALLSGCETLPKGQDRFEKNHASSLPKEGAYVEQELSPLAKEIIQKAESGDVEAQNMMGAGYYTGKGVPQNYKEAAKWYTRAAKQGHAEAQKYLGWMYYNGQGVPQNYKEAVKWFTISAEQGDLEAQTGLGVMYDFGRGVPQDYKEAVKWYTRAARQGNAEAQYKLSLSYYLGEGVPQDFKEAARWCFRAAEQGYADAQNNMGAMYQRGEGVPQDYVQACKWYNLASAQEAKNAKENRDILRNIMTPAQIAEAQRVSREFRPKTGEHIASPAREPAVPAILTNGTGFFITADGYLLTAYHVVKEAAAFQVWTYGRLIPAQLVRVDATNDIALLKLDGITVAALPVISSRNVRTGLDVFTLGFPNIQLQGTEVKYTQGNISSLTGAGDDPRLFQISVPVQPGNSGGPLLDAQGQVIGVVIAKLDEIFTARATGSLPQNVNYALKSSLVLSFLESLPELSGKLVQTKNSGLSRTQVVKQSGNAVVMVLGY